MRAVVYDAAVLIAADRSERRTWAKHKARLELGLVPIVPAPVVAQVSRSPRQAQLHRFLAGCEIASLDEPAAHAVGRVLAASDTDDVVDGAVVVLAASRGAVVLTGDPGDIARLVDASRSGRHVAVVAV